MHKEQLPAKEKSQDEQLRDAAEKLFKKSTNKPAKIAGFMKAVEVMSALYDVKLREQQQEIDTLKEQLAQAQNTTN